MTTSGLLAALIAGAIFAASPGPDPAVPDTKLDATHTPPARTAVRSEDEAPPPTAWWTLFEDPTLDACVARAYRRNGDLEMALARVEQARAVLGETKSYQSPTLDGQFTASRGRILGPTVGMPSDREQDGSMLVGSINYELDLFGRLRHGTAASRADWLATRAAHDNVRLVLAANVARSYFNLRCLDEQLAILRETLHADRRTLAILRERYTLGKDDELNARRFEAQTASVERMLRQHEDALSQNETALMVLMGADPAEMETARAHAPISVDLFPTLPELPTGLSPRILDRRPDLMQIRLEYAAALARVDKAEAERYPTLDIGALLGAAGGSLDDLFSGSTGWSLTGQLTAPIFDAGRRKSRAEQARALAWETHVRYEQTARTAFGEIVDAIGTRENLAQQAEQYEIMLDAQSKTYDLAAEQFQGGKVGQLDVLDAHRSLLQVRLDRATNRRDRLNAAVGLCLALGGGWDDMPTQQPGETANDAQSDTERYLQQLRSKYGN